MQIAMELLAPAISRADSGAGVKQKAQSDGAAVSAFEKIMEEKRPVNKLKGKPDGGKTGRLPGKEDETLDKPKKPEDGKDADKTVIIGVTGNQNMVVVILEGDKESATIPEINIDVIAEADMIPDRVVPADEQGTKNGPVTADAEPEPVKPDTEAAPAAIGAADIMNAAERVSDGRVITSDVDTAKVETPETSATDALGGVTGEVTARTPETRTSEQQENKEDNSGFLKDGDLSPLENDSDKTPVKGPKTRTFQQIADDVQNKTEGTQEQAHTQVPLTDGIKPERFRADQQMRQAATDAPVRAENLFDEMVSRIEMMQTETKSAMTIQLKPEFLGNVALEIAVDAAGLHVKINAQDSSVRSMIGGQMAALIESLENKGIAVVEVEVAYTGVDNGAFKDSREGRAQPDGQQRSYRHRPEPADGMVYYTTLPVDALGYYLDEDVSSVEYRA